VNTTRAGITERRIDVWKARTYLLNPPRTTKDYQFTSSAPGWIANQSNWTVTGGFLQVTSGLAGWKVVSINTNNSPCNEGLDISTRLWRVWGGTDNGVSGILFKGQFVNSTRFSGYFVGVRRGQLQLFRFDDYQFGNDNGRFQILCDRTVTLSNDGFQRLRIVTRGGNHRIYLNGAGSPTCNVTDYTYGTGVTGAAAFFQQEVGGNGFALDNFNAKPVEVVGSNSPNPTGSVNEEPNAGQPGTAADLVSMVNGIEQ
jgi:hypothetical protein